MIDPINVDKQESNASEQVSKQLSNKLNTGKKGNGTNEKWNKCQFNGNKNKFI